MSYFIGAPNNGFPNNLARPNIISTAQPVSVQFYPALNIIILVKQKLKYVVIAALLHSCRKCTDCKLMMKSPCALHHLPMLKQLDDIMITGGHFLELVNSL